jgi:hypothetical protein
MPHTESSQNSFWKENENQNNPLQNRIEKLNEQRSEVFTMAKVSM